MTQVYEAAGGCAVVVQTTSGSITVAGWDRPQVTVEAVDGQAAVRRSGSRLVVDSLPNGSTSLVLRVPRLCSLDLGTIGGAISVLDVLGRVLTQTMAGDVAVTRLSGALVSRSVSGAVAVRGAHLRELVADSVSGDLSIATTLSPDGRYSLRSVSGGLHLALPATARCTLRIQSLLGALRCGLPCDTEHRGWAEVEARVNGGGIEVTAITASGTVAVSSADEAAAESPHAEAAAAPRDSAQGKRLAILAAFEQGRLTVDEGLEQLRQIDSGQADGPPSAR